MRIAILLPDGVGLRNYIYTDLIPKIHALGAEIILISVFSDAIVDKVDEIHHLKIPNIQMPSYKEGILERFFRELGACCRVRRNARVVSNDTILDFWNPKKTDVLSRIFFTLIAGISRLCSRSLSRIRMVDDIHSVLINKREFGLFLKDLNVDKLLCTHQRSLYAIPAMKAAKSLGIETITVIYSWDNMPKGRLPIRTDKYFVWSDYMKEEFSMFYPDINPENVIVTGTPQFEFYGKKELLWSRQEFCDRHGIPVEKKILCYSGDDTLTSPYDPDYLEDLVQTLIEVDSNHEVAILLRKCPVDLSGRFLNLIAKYPERIFVSDPIWEKDNDNGWVGLYPTKSDVELLCNVAYHCDAVYNVGSTMAFDFCMFNHPAYYINYNQAHAEGWSVDRIYRFQHFRTMPSTDCVVWVNCKAELRKLMQAFIDASPKCTPQTYEWYNMVNSGGVNGVASDNIAESLVI